MSTFQRHWRTFSLQGLLAITLLGLVMAAFWPGGFLALAQDSTREDLDVALYTQTQQLRGELGLGNADLATLGVSQAQAEAVLTAMLDWTGQHQSQLASREQAIHTARRELREAMEKIHVGPRDEGLLARVPNLHVNVNKAVASREQLLDTAAAAAIASLTAAQRTTWQTLRDNRDLPRRYRVASNLTASQRETLREDLHKAARHGESAGSVETAVLSAHQRQAIRTADEQRGSAMNGVLLAEHNVLPMPVELKEEAIEPTPLQPEG